MAFVPPQPYLGCTVTLTADTVTNLLAAVKALGGKYANAASAYREVNLYADAANDAGNPIWIGDDAVAPGNYGYALGPTSSRTYRSDTQKVFFGDMYAKSHGVSQALHIELLGA